MDQEAHMAHEGRDQVLHNMKHSYSRFHILVAEHDAGTHALLRQLLGDRYNMTIVADGQAALASAREQVPDLVLIDAKLPGMDAVDVLHMLKAEPATRAVPAIILLEHANNGVSTEALEAAADDVVLKPLNHAELLARVEAQFKLQQVRREAQVALQASEEKFATAFRYSPLALTIVSLKTGQLVDVNEAFVELSGYTREEVLGRTPEELNLWVDPKQRAEGLVGLRAGKHLAETEARFRIKGGSLLTGMISATLIQINGQAHVLSSVVDITARKQQEEQLRESEEKFRLFVDHAPAAVAMLDREMRYLALSRRWMEHYKVSDDVIGRSHYEVFPEISERWKEIHRRCLAGAIEQSDEDVFERADGTVEWLKWEVRPWYKSTGQIGGIVIFAEDITERKRTEQRLRASEERMRLATEAAGMFAWETDLRAQTITWSENAARIIGCAPEDMPTTMDSGHFFVIPEDSPRLDREFAAILQRRDSTYTFEFRGAGAGNMLRYWRAQGAIRYDMDGTPIQVFGVTQDITEHRRAEEALRQERARLEAVLRQLPEGVIIAEAPSGKLILGNEQVAQIWQHQFIASETVDEYDMYKGFHPDGRPYLPEEWPLARTVTTGEVVANEEIRFQRGTGSFGWMAVSSVPIRDDDGTIIAGVVTFADITERKAFEAALHESERRLQILYTQEQVARAEAEEASRLKDEFLATVSHELRTPLTSILGYGQLLLTRPRDTAYVARTVAKIVQSAQAQSQLIEDLLDVSRIVSGKLRLEMQPIDFTTVVRAALDTVRPTVEAKQLTLYTDLNPEASTVVGDANRLQQVVWNLLSNAAKFTPSGGAITVRLEARQHEIQLMVSDTGQGINPNFLPYVFDRFRQADGTSTRSSGGLGLGLSIVRHLVELHGGSVQVASEGEGKGAVFTVRLPLAGVDDAVTNNAIGMEDVLETCPAELRGLRVLLVDDQPDILELLEEMLMPCGCITKACDNAQDALEAAQNWKPDVLVSDIAMPHEDGYWLIGQVRALPAEKGGAVPAVALTAYVRVEEHMRVLAAGFQQYVPKPLETQELRAIIASITQETSGM